MGGAILPSNIKSERARLDLTQGELASLLNVDESTVRRWECDASSLKAGNLKRMCSIFNCSTDYILGLTDERTPISK